ncbi:hypothetical protein ABIC37_000278 [Priestia megaterium]|uniref:hypothetical protein n=1 Tax=Priestia megaterium TaxID=1404 RepID=UPI0004B3922D|nr:hypothetical protein [Priestia megaterium]
MIRGQGEDSCGKSGTDEEAHRPSVESEDLHGNQLRWHKQSIRAHVYYLSVFRLDHFSNVSTSS